MKELTQEETEKILLEHGFMPHVVSYGDNDKHIRWEKYGREVFATSNDYPTEYYINIIIINNHNTKSITFDYSRDLQNDEIAYECHLMRCIEEFENLYKQYKELGGI